MSFPIRTRQGIDLTGIDVAHRLRPPATRADGELPPGADSVHHRLVWPASRSTAHVTAGAQSFLIRSPDAVWVRATSALIVHGVAAVGVARFDATTCPQSWSRTTQLQLPEGVVVLLEWIGDNAPRSFAADVASVATEQLGEAHARAPFPLPLPVDPDLRSVATALIADPGDQRSAAVLAHARGLKEQTFRRRFVGETGLTFTRWRTELRIRTAMTLLEAGRPVSEVAGRCGYASAGAFTRAFKEATSLPPSSFARLEPPLRELRGERPLLRDAAREPGEVTILPPDLSTFSTRAAGLAAAGMLLLGAACGSDDETADDARPTTTTTTLADEPDTSDVGATVDESTPTSDGEPGEDETSTPAPSAITSVPPTSTEPAAQDGPTRVVATENRLPLDHALALGLPVVGYPEKDIDGVDGTSPFMSEALAEQDDVQILWSGLEVNFEVLAATEPDLIIARSAEVAILGEQLEEIAPVYSADFAGPWQDVLFDLAEETGRVAEAQTFIERYDERVQQIATDRADVLDQPIAVIQFSPPDQIALRGLDYFQNQLIADIGGVTTERAAAIESRLTEELSRERFDQPLEGATGAFVVANGESVIAELEDDPLWGISDIARNGTFVISSFYSNSGGPLTALGVLELVDELYATLQANR